MYKAVTRAVNLDIAGSEFNDMKRSKQLLLGQYALHQIQRKLASQRNGNYLPGKTPDYLHEECAWPAVSVVQQVCVLSLVQLIFPF